MNMDLPGDPHILLSYINMKLRDEYRNLEALCEDFNIVEKDLRKRLQQIGYDYDTGINQFKNV